MEEDACPQCDFGRHKQCVNPTLCGCEICRKLKWETPPPRRTRLKDWLPSEKILDALRANIGSWARIYDFSTRRGAEHPARKINKGMIIGTGWEASERRHLNSSILYLRYIGHDEARSDHSGDTED